MFIPRFKIVFRFVLTWKTNSWTRKCFFFLYLITFISSILYDRLRNECLFLKMFLQIPEGFQPWIFFGSWGRLFKVSYPWDWLVRNNGPAFSVAPAINSLGSVQKDGWWLLRSMGETVSNRLNKNVLALLKGRIGRPLEGLAGPHYGPGLARLAWVVQGSS